MTSSLGHALMCLEEQEHLLYPKHSHRLRKVCRDTTDVPFHLEIPRKYEATVLGIRSHSNAPNACTLGLNLQTASHDRRPAADSP